MPQFLAPDGAALYFDAYEPAEGNPKSAVLFLPGWSDHAARWSRVGERLRQASVAAYLLDVRGHGRSGGRQGHLSRFSQLLADLQAFRRVVRQRTQAPQVLLGHSFGALVALRYLESQPSDAIAAAVLVSPWLGLAFPPPRWKLALGRLLPDVWPTLTLSTGIEPDHLSRDPAVGAAYETDPLVHNVITTGAWREIQWAQRVVAADAGRIEPPLLFLLAGEDRIVDAQLARAFADSLKSPVQVQWYPEMYHEILHDPQAEEAMDDLLQFLARRELSAGPR